MQTRRLTAILALLALLIAPTTGCLSLNMLNRESVETKLRVDSLEQRVQALEATRVSQPAPPMMSGAPMQSQSPRAIPLGQNPSGYP
jgi:hypothetical protein